MPNYQIYFFDPDGELLKAEEIRSPNDADAIQKMKLRMDGNRVELWRASNKIEESNNMDSAVGWQIPKGASIVQTNGYPMAYMESGAGTPLLLIHGSLSDYRVWPMQWEAFSADHRLIAPSLRHYYPEPWDGIAALNAIDGLND